MKKVLIFVTKNVSVYLKTNKKPNPSHKESDSKTSKTNFPKICILFWHI